MCGNSKKEMLLDNKKTVILRHSFFIYKILKIVNRRLGILQEGAAGPEANAGKGCGGMERYPY